MKKKIAIFAGILFFCASCSKLDVVGDGSVVSFENLLNNKNVSVGENEKKDSWILFVGGIRFRRFAGDRHFG